MDECTFTSTDLDLPKDAISILGLDNWECSRPVWEERDEVDDRCVWHADTADKPPSKLKSGINRGDLHGALIPSETDLTSLSFPEKTRLTNANLSGVSINGADLSGATLPSVDLSGATLDNVDLSGAYSLAADLSGASFTGADLSEVELSRAHLSEVNLNGADLSKATLFSADLSEADLDLARLSGADLNGADLSEADLRFARLSGADLNGADLSNAYLQNADLSGADLSGANLPRADLNGTHLTEADLSDTDLTDAAFQDADVSATLERANLTRANLFEADLRGAAFYGAVTTDTQLNQKTKFGEHYTDAEESVGDADIKNARWCLRRIEQLADLNALPDQSREAFLQRRDLRRREAKAADDWGEWLLLAGARWVMGYGESFARVLSTAGVIIVVSTLLYPIWGVNLGPDGRLAYPPVDTSNLLGYYGALVDTLLTSLYFSVLTFTTLGFGDLRPVGLGRALATFEAAAGVTLFALLVFVLGRRSTR